MQASLSLAQEAPKSPQALGEKMIAAIQAKDKNALTALIHPEVVSYMKTNDPQQLDETMKNWMNTKVPPNHEFIVQPVTEVPDYDPSSQMLTFGSVKMYFPTPPSDFLILIGDVEAKVKVDGKEELKKGRGPVTIDAVTQNEGSWYVVLPVLKSGGSEAQPKN